MSDWISSITEIARQSTDRKAVSFFFPLCTVKVGIFDFIHHLPIAVGIPESQFDFTKLMNEEKKIPLVLCLLFFGSCTPGTLANWALLMVHCHSATVEVLKLLLTLKELVHQNA